MRLSLKHKLIYLANPKTGSTSIRKLMDPISDHELLKKQNQYSDHYGVKDFLPIFQSNKWNWDEFYSFCTIRNPWDKYVSNYHFSKPDCNFLHFYEEGYHPDSALTVSFREWLMHNFTHRGFPKGCPPLEFFTSDFDGRCSVNEIIPIDKFLQSNLRYKLEKVLGSNLIVPKLNTTSREHYREYYDDETVELVASACSMDIEIGGYRF